MVVDIIIPRYFYQKWPFWVFVFAFIGGIFYVGTRLYYTQKLKEQQRIFEKQRIIQDERNRIGDELHDDLGAGLSLIRVLSHSIEGKLSDSKLNKRAGQISKTSDDLIQNMKDILWAMDTNNNSSNDLISHIRAYIQTYLPLNNLQYTFEAEELAEDIELQGSKRRNIYLIIKESLHNIVKHANANMVNIKIKIEDDQLLISIEDDGIGIKKENMRAAGKGLKSIKKRATDVAGNLSINSTEGEGTTIIAKIPLN